MAKRRKIKSSSDDMQALMELLERLEHREEVRRYQEVTNAYTRIDADDLVEIRADEDEEDEVLIPPKANAPLQPARYEPNTLTDTDLADLLIRPEDDILGEDLGYEEPRVTLLEMPDEEDEELPQPPTTRRNPLKVLWDGFRGNLPSKEDSTGTKVRKCGFLTSLLVMLLAIAYLMVDLLVVPAQNNQLKDELIEIYHPEETPVVISPTEDQYPEKMLASFRELYDRNEDVRGWISFHAGGNKDFLNIEHAVVSSGDNEKYLKLDFDGNKNRNGTLFFDMVNTLDSYTDNNRSLIVHGHNMASGQMFAGLNKLLGSASNARTCPTLTLSTLYRQDMYLVFAVVLIDEDDHAKGHYFNMRRNDFTTDEEFLDYVSEIRARSTLDYPVEVRGDDRLLVLSTCSNKSTSHLKDGRVVVVARRVRIGEQVRVNTDNIQKNSDVIMPYNWYVNQNKKPHEYYSMKQDDPTGTTTTTTGQTTLSEDTTDTTDTTNTTDTIDTTDTTDVTESTDTTDTTDVTETTTVKEDTTDTTDRTTESSTTTAKETTTTTSQTVTAPGTTKQPTGGTTTTTATKGTVTTTTTSKTTADTTTEKSTTVTTTKTTTTTAATTTTTTTAATTTTTTTAVSTTTTTTTQAPTTTTTEDTTTTEEPTEPTTEPTTEATTEATTEPTAEPTEPTTTE